MKQIAKGSSVLTVVSIGEMLMRFIRTKLIAIILGPTGTGFLAQITIFFEILRIWGDLGARRALIRQVAEERFNGTATQNYRAILKTSYSLVTATSFLVGIFVVIFSKPISHLLYGTEAHYPFIVALAFILPISSLSTVTASIVKGNLAYMDFAKYTLCSYFVAVMATPFLIYFLNTWGAVISMALFFLFPLLGYLILNWKRKFLHFSKQIDFHTLKDQFSDGFIQIYQDSLTHLVRMAIAIWIIRKLGLDLMGIYQVVLTFTTVYMAVPIHAINGYVFPLIAASKTSREVNLAINDSMRFVMFILVPVIISIMILPELIIHLFFSSEFLPAAPILRLQIFSTLFILMGYSFMSALTAKGKLKSVFLISTAYLLIFLGLSWILFQKWQLMGVAFAATVSSVFNYVMQYFAVRHYFGTRLDRKNQRLVLMTLFWMIITYVGITFYDHLALRMFLLAFGFIWFMGSSKDHERRFLTEKFTHYVRRVRVAFVER